MLRLLGLVLLAAALSAATIALPVPFSVDLGNARGPVQPIKFPHDVHAGKLGLDCLYCHYGAEKSAVANLPAVSTCMGCHKLAATDRPEIQKLTSYWQKGEPIPWVEVYWLPDHVKFNHQRHVKAGFTCQTCHGPVEEARVVSRYSSLKMGWCIDCHRQHLRDPKFPASMDCLLCHH